MYFAITHYTLIDEEIIHYQLPYFHFNGFSTRVLLFNSFSSTNKRESESQSRGSVYLMLHLLNVNENQTY